MNSVSDTKDKFNIASGLLNLDTMPCHAIGESDLVHFNTRAEEGFLRKEAGDIDDIFSCPTFNILSCTLRPSSFDAGPPSATLETTIPPPAELFPT